MLRQEGRSHHKRESRPHERRGRLPNIPSFRGSGFQEDSKEVVEAQRWAAALVRAIEVITGPAEFEAVKNALEAAGLRPEVAEVTMRPENTIELAGEEGAKMQKLLDMLEDLDDVQNVYHNAEIGE